MRDRTTTCQVPPFEYAASRRAFIFSHRPASVSFHGDSLMPSSPATCLFRRPATTSVMTSASRRVSDA
jgi:hypothetical protein